MAVKWPGGCSQPTGLVSGTQWQTMVDAMVIAPLAKMLGEWFNIDPSEIDTIAEIEAKLHEFFDDMPIIGDLIEVFTGMEDGNLDDLGTWINTVLKPGISGLIDFSRIPKLSLSQLTNQPGPNLLTGFGDFASEETMDGGGDWVWDATVGGGSARAAGDALTRKVLTSELVPVSEGEELAVAGKVQWNAASGSGSTMQLVIQPYIGDAAQAEVVISEITSPSLVSSGWVSLSDEWTVPVNVDGVRVRITVEAALLAGTVWWDDVSLRKTATSLPQQFITGLTDALSDLGEWIESLVDQLLTALGIPTLGTLWDKINDLGDEVSGWFDDTQDFFGQLDDLVGDLLADPAAVIGSIPQTIVSGLGTALGSLGDDIGAVIDALFQGYTGGSGTGNAPAALAGVGTNIANRLDALEKGGTKYRITSNTTLDLTGATVIRIILIGGGTDSAALTYGGYGAINNGHGGSDHGGFWQKTFSAASLTSLGVNLSAFQVEVGTAGNPSRAGKYESSSWALTSTPGVININTVDGYTVTTSGLAPGSGGNGGYDPGNSNPATAGQAGSAGYVAGGGTPGSGGAAASIGNSGSAGSPGGSTDGSGQIDGGGGGGGGGGAGEHNTLGFGQNGGNGANGGYPGGGGGGGGGAGHGTYSDGSRGSRGANGNGFVMLDVLFI